MSGLGFTFLRRGGLSHPTAGSDYIKIEDEEVFNVLMAKGVSSDGVGITKADCANVSDISTWFKGNTNVVDLSVLRYFINVTSLTTSALEGCTSLAMADFSNIRTIGANALKNCTSLMGRLDLSNCTTIGMDALMNVGAEEVDLSNAVSLPTPGTSNSVYGNKSIVKKIILSSATKIPKYSFYSYTALEEVVMSENLEEIGQGAFSRCTAYSVPLYAPRLLVLGAYAFEYSSIPEVISAGGITTILDNTFASCTKLKKFSFPNSLQTIGRLACQKCDLQDVELGENIQSLSNSVFEYNNNMKYAIVRAITPPTIANIYVWANTGNCPIYVPDESVDAYKAANLWSNSAISNRIKPLSEFNG